MRKINRLKWMHTLSLSVKTEDLEGNEAAFSLIELLVVIAIGVVISLFAIPALMSLSTSGNFKGNVSQVSSLLEEAYSAAIVKNTYVWVGFSQVTTNNGGVEIGFVYSAHGSPTDLANNNVLILNKPVFLPNLALTTISSSQVSDPGRATLSVGLITNANIPLFSVKLSGSNQILSNVMQINPSGQITISSSGNKYACIELGLEPLRGNPNNVAVLQINAFTGRVSTFLP